MHAEKPKQKLHMFRLAYLGADCVSGWVLIVSTYLQV